MAMVPIYSFTLLYFFQINGFKRQCVGNIKSTVMVILLKTLYFFLLPEFQFFAALFPCDVTLLRRHLTIRQSSTPALIGRQCLHYNLLGLPTYLRNH